MNDYSEVQYGLTLLKTVYNSPAVGTNFKNSLNKIYDGITTTIEEQFNGWIPAFALDTYVTCFSEHLDVEDAIGRLSMWRAYGNPTGVALVINNAVLLKPAPGLNAYSSAVAYLRPEQFEAECERVAANISREADFIRTQSRETIVSQVFNMFRFAIVCTKHPGFFEEREWRVVHTPSYEKSLHLIKELRTVNGLPQCIYRIPLRDIPEVSYFGAISELVNRIIIGPTQYPRPLLEAFVELLGEAGVKEPQTKVCLSNIPLRS